MKLDSGSSKPELMVKTSNLKILVEEYDRLLGLVKDYVDVCEDNAIFRKALRDIADSAAPGYTLRQMAEHALEKVK